jgi:hypothetical protein
LIIKEKPLTLFFYNFKISIINDFKEFFFYFFIFLSQLAIERTFFSFWMENSTVNFFFLEKEK